MKIGGGNDTKKQVETKKLQTIEFKSKMLIN